MQYAIETGSKRGKFMQELSFEPDIEPDIIVPGAKICSFGSVGTIHQCYPSNSPFFNAVLEKELDFLRVVLYFPIIGTRT